MYISLWSQKNPKTIKLFTLFSWIFVKVHYQQWYFTFHEIFIFETVLLCAQNNGELAFLLSYWDKAFSSFHCLSLKSSCKEDLRSNEDRTRVKHLKCANLFCAHSTRLKYCMCCEEMPQYLNQYKYSFAIFSLSYQYHLSHLFTLLSLLSSPFYPATSSLLALSTCSSLLSYPTWIPFSTTSPLFSSHSSLFSLLSSLSAPFYLPLLPILSSSNLQSTL